MDPSEQLSLPHNLTRISSDTEEDYSPHQPQHKIYPYDLQSDGTEVGSLTPGSYSYPFYQYVPRDESENLSIQQSVPNTPNDQSQFYPQLPFLSNDLSHTHDRVPDSSVEGHLTDNDTRYFASIQAQGASGSDRPGSSYTTIADTSPSPGFHSQYRGQDDHTRATSFSRGQVEGAAQSHAVTQGHDATKEELLRRRMERKRERDRIRKGGDRAADDRAYSRVCILLALDLDPKNTRSERILNGVESIDQDFERMCELLEISMTPRKTLAHRILEGVGAMVERQKLDRDIRRQLEEREAEVAFLRTDIFSQSH